jgi:uncharacterized delta-60 repeat protein
VKPSIGKEGIVNPKQSFIVTMALLIATLVTCLAPAFAQVDTAWVRRYNGPGNDRDEASAIVVDNSGNVYVTGKSDGGVVTNWDYATIKYYPNGDTAWVRRYDAGANGLDVPYAIVVDTSGNVCVTGRSFAWATSYDYLTIKYYLNGDLAWLRRYNGPGNSYDWAYAIAGDASGNVYVTGYSEGSGTVADFATIKYYPNGDTAWVRRYNGPVNGSDEALAIVVDGAGNVYVTGESYGSGTSYDYATLKYDSSGNELWVERYNKLGNYWDEAYAIAVDSSGNVYITGRSYGDGTGQDFATIKYNPNGDTAWVRRYNGPGNAGDEAHVIALDGSNNIYVAGGSVGDGTDYDYAIIKYNPNGDTAWVRRYTGTESGYDYAWAMVIDSSNNVYVTGESNGSGTSLDYATIKYDTEGNKLWVARYNAPGNAEDQASAIAIDDSNNVYVTGRSRGLLSNRDYATIKYIPCDWQSITVISPNGGETWQSGSYQYIRWSSSCFAGDVRIDYSINSGVSFDSIICSSCPNTGQYLWRVPYTSSGSCRVRLCDAMDCDPADISDNDFMLTYHVPVLTSYGILVFAIFLIGTAVWMIKRKRLVT